MCEGEPDTSATLAEPPQPDMEADLAALLDEGTVCYAVGDCSAATAKAPDMTKTSPVSLRLEAGLNERIAAIAVAMDRPKSWAIEQAVKDFVEVQEWQLAAVAEGIEAADEGRVVAHEAVAAWVGSWGEANESPPPKCA